jgi:hypothetical protein
MFGKLFGGKRTFLDSEDEAWMTDVCGWLVRHFGGMSRLGQVQLVKPTAEFRYLNRQGTILSDIRRAISETEKMPQASHSVRH